MATYEVDGIIRYANDLQEKLDALTAENTRLSTPFGVLKKPHALPLQSYYVSDLLKPGYWKGLETKYEQSVPLAAENDEVNSHNSAVVQNLRQVISTTGFSAERREYKRNKWVSVPNEWAHCLNYTLGEGSQALEKRWADTKKKYAETVAAAEATKKKEEQAKQAEEKEAWKRIAFVDLCRDVELDPLETGLDQVKEKLLASDKYLDLAAAGIETRCDWSDGCWRVRNALGRFSVADARDQEIYEEWQELCDDFEDGRVFRDCKWNYDRVMELVTPDLQALWKRAKECE